MLRAFVVVVVAVLVIGCSSSKQPPPSPAPVAPVAPVAIDAFAPDAPRPDAPSTAAVVIDAAPPVDAGAKPITKRTPHRPCPACGIGCPHGVPSRATDENGCTVCACEDLLPRP